MYKSTFNRSNDLCIKTASCDMYTPHNLTRKTGSINIYNTCAYNWKNFA